MPLQQDPGCDRTPEERQDPDVSGGQNSGEAACHLLSNVPRRTVRDEQTLMERRSREAFHRSDETARHRNCSSNFRIKAQLLRQLGNKNEQHGDWTDSENSLVKLTTGTMSALISETLDPHRKKIIGFRTTATS